MEFMRRDEREEKVFLQNEPKSPFRINKEVGSLMASFGFDRPKKPPESQSKPLIEGLCNGFQGGLPAGVNQEWQASGNAVMLSKAGAQALRPVL